MNTQLKKGALELCVLSQLVRGDMYGYALTEKISGEMSIAGGTLYPILRRSGSGPARKYYQLTEKGRQRQSTVRKEWEDFAAAVNRLLD